MIRKTGIVFALLIILSGMISCESYKEISFTVLDAADRKPLDSVSVRVFAGKNGDYRKNYSEGYTDVNGTFKTNMMIGCSFGCYDIIIECARPGYATACDTNNINGEKLLYKK